MSQPIHQGDLPRLFRAFPVKAVFSVFSGLALVILADPLSALMRVGRPGGVIRLIGAGRVLLAARLVWIVLVMRPDPLSPTSRRLAGGVV